MAQVLRWNRQASVWKRRGYTGLNSSPSTVTPVVAPSGSPVSSTFTVMANGQATACYETAEADFANFAVTSGTTTVQVTYNAAVTSVSVHPEKFGIVPTFTSGQTTFSFTITQPHNYVVFINGDPDKPLYIFANPAETTTPNPSDYTYYYGPGYYNQTKPDGSPLNADGALILNAGQSCYVHPNAYVKGKIYLGAEQSNVGPIFSNIHLSGYGVVDSVSVTSGNGPGRPGKIGNVDGASITGTTFIGQIHWGMPILESNDVTLTNVKMLNYKITTGTPDGIDIVGSTNVTYDGCFIRAQDDAIAIKTWKNGFGPSPYWRGNVENITIVDCVIDQGDGGNGVEIGYENFNNNTTGSPVNDPRTGLPVAYIRNITYRRLDIVRKRRDPAIMYRMAGLGMHLVDDVPVSNVLYEDVNVEYCDGQFWIWFGAFASGDYSYGSGRAQITDITLRRVSFDGPNSLPIHLQGGGSGVTLYNIVMQDVYVKGTKLTNTSAISGKVTWEISNVAGPSGATGPIFG